MSEEAALVRLRSGLATERAAHQRTRKRLADATKAVTQNMADHGTRRVDAAMQAELEALRARTVRLEGEVAELSAERALCVAFIQRNVERLDVAALAAVDGTVDVAIVDDGAAAFFESMSQDALKTAALLDIEKRGLADENMQLRRQISQAKPRREVAEPWVLEANARAVAARTPQFERAVTTTTPQPQPQPQPSVYPPPAALELQRARTAVPSVAIQPLAAPREVYPPTRWR